LTAYNKFRFLNLDDLTSTKRWRPQLRRKPIEHDDRNDPGATRNAGHWIKASIASDGKYAITNTRNNYAETCRSR